MKRLLLTAVVLGSIFLSGCEKDDALVPAEKTLLKADKGILCRGCGDWDFETPGDRGAASFRTATYDGQPDTVAAPGRQDQRTDPAQGHSSEK